MTGSLNWGDLVKDASSGGGGNFEPLPAGDYDIKVVEATAAQSSSGKTMFKLKTEVQGGPYNGRLLWDNLVISPENANALGFFFRKMTALGLGAQFFEQNPSNAQIEQALQHRTARAKVIVRQYNGNPSNNIDTYYPAQSTGTPSFAPQAPQGPPQPPQGNYGAPQAPQGAPQGYGAPAAPQGPPQGAPAYGGQPQAPQYGAPPQAPTAPTGYGAPQAPQGGQSPWDNNSGPAAPPTPF